MLPVLLEAAVETEASKIFALFKGADQWSYAETLRKSRCWAAGLSHLGVARGDRVAVWLPDWPESVLAWFAISTLGAVIVPLNAAYRGSILTHVLVDSGAATLIAHSKLLESLNPEDLARLRTVVAVALPANQPYDRHVIPVEVLEPVSAGSVPPRIWNPGIRTPSSYTSGTTGRSKGVLCSYLHSYTLATAAYGFMNAADRILVNMPLFHVTGFAAVYIASDSFSLLCAGWRL